MPHLHALILTLFPEMFPGPLGCSLAGKALAEGVWRCDAVNIRDFATSKHQNVDDRPYGGGAGMVMRPDVVGAAIEAAKAQLPGAAILYPSPRGALLTQGRIKTLVNSGKAIIVCGRFEGLDQRVLDAYEVEEVSLGDYVLSGGELAAMAILDAAVRLLPGVMGAEDAGSEESFGDAPGYAGLLEYPHYTRPAEWQGRTVPEVLVSGHHAEVARWRKEQAQAITQQRRPDLWARHTEEEMP
jgi:tRNA (guanine37-N1)-methyltransferase